MKRLAQAVLLVLLAVSTADPAQGPPALPDALNPAPEKVTVDSSKVTVVASFRTATGALRQLHFLRERFPGVHGAVYSPRREKHCCWTVVIASYASPEQSRQMAYKARSLGIARNAYVLTLQGSISEQEHFRLYPPSADINAFPNALADAPKIVTDDRDLILLLGTYQDVTAAEAIARRWESQFSGLHLAVVQAPNGEFGVAIATFVGKQVETESLAAVKAMGIVRDKFQEVVLPSGIAPQWTTVVRPGTQSALAAETVITCYKSAHSFSVEELHACSGIWLTPQTLTRCLLSSDCLGVRDPVDVERFLSANGLTRNSVLNIDPNSIPDYGRAAELGKAIQECRSTAGKSPQEFEKCIAPHLLSPTEEKVASCAANSKTGTDLTNCFLPAVGNDDLRKQIECLQSHFKEDDRIGTCLADAGLQDKMKSINQCASSVQGKSDPLRRCVLPTFSPQDRKKAECLLKTTNGGAAQLGCIFDDRTEIREAQKITVCVEAGPNQAARAAACLADRVGGDLAKIRTCLGSGLITPELAATCAMPAKPELASVARLSSCLLRSKDASSVLTNCASGFVDQQAVAVVAVSCAISAQTETDLMRRCVLPTLPDDDQRKAACMLQNRTDEAATLGCVIDDRSEIKNALAIEQCVERSNGDQRKAGLCLARRFGGDVGQIAGCLGDGPVTAELAATCAFPSDSNIGKAARLASCAATAADAASMLASCSTGLVDPKIQTATACVARSSGATEKLVGCGASLVLPPEAARVAACAATSQSVSAFAVCSVAPVLSPEWEIAAECAVSTGGQPVAFGTCTAGRLSLRELSKCLTGQIGKDCFGENNEIVKFYGGLGDSILHGPGDASVVRQIGTALQGGADGAAHFGNEVAKATGGLAQTVSQDVHDGAKWLGDRTGIHWDIHW